MTLVVKGQTIEIEIEMEGKKLQPRLNGIWLALIVLAGVFSLMYLWFTFFPGRAAPAAGHYFTAGQISRGRQYNQILQLVWIAGFLTQAACLLWLVFGGRAPALSRWFRQAAGDHYWGSLLLFFLFLWLLLRLLNLPFNFFGSYVWQHHWGFSTQTVGSWGLDYLKGAGIDLAFSAAGVMLLFWAMCRWPGFWWLAGAVFVSLWLIIQTLLWPVAVAPLFNRFVPAKDPAVLAMVHQLAEKARLPVDHVLIMDAGRRTTKANAYYAGLGRTKRIVLYDNLLANYPPDEVRAVVAHEMAHWRQGHLGRGLALGLLGNFILWGFLFVVFRTTLPPSEPYPPYTWAVIFLFVFLVSFVSSPLQNYFSRQMEAEADRVAVTLTGDAPAAVRLQVDLAAKNLADVSPAPFIEWFGSTHPAPLTRIENIDLNIQG